MRPALPDFENPPVIEVVLGIQFAEIKELGVPQIGMLWEKFRDRLPKTEDHPALDPVYEIFDIRPQRKFPIKFEIITSPPTPRCWFLNNTGTELVQIQRNRIIHNWRKVGADQEYPRYDKIKKIFEKDIILLQVFLDENGFSPLIPDQWEVTYVNHISVEKNFSNSDYFEQIFSVWNKNYSDGFLNTPENINFSSSYIIRNDEGNPIGRTHITATPAIKKDDEMPIIILTITTRGTPSGENTDSILEDIDVGRENVVRSFASITTPFAHNLWKRKDA